MRRKAPPLGIALSMRFSTATHSCGGHHDPLSTEALIRELSQIVQNDRYPLSPRIVGPDAALARLQLWFAHDLYGAFSVKRLFWVVLRVFCSERERPFFVPSPAIRFPERAEGVKGPKR